MTIFFKCPKCGSTDIRNKGDDYVKAHVCYGCGYKWGYTPDRKRVMRYRLIVVCWILLLILIIEYFMIWINM